MNYLFFCKSLPVLIFLLVVTIVLLHLLYSAYSLYVLDALYACLSFGSILTLGWYRVPVSRVLYSSYHEYSQYLACWYTVCRYILPTLLSIYIYDVVFFQDSHYEVFQGFPLYEVLRVNSMSLGEYLTRVCCCISRFDTVYILWVLAIIRLH